MAHYKFTPDLMSQSDIESISVGRERDVNYVVDKLQKSIKKNFINHIVFIGPRGIGKSHMILRIMNKIPKEISTPVRFSEEEYSINDLNAFFKRILDILNKNHTTDVSNVIEETQTILKTLKKNGKPVILYIENLQMLFDQLHDDLDKLRSIMQTDQSFYIVGSATTFFPEIASPDEPFYNYFELMWIKGLNETEVKKLLQKRLILANKESLSNLLDQNSSRIKGIHLLTGGNPRLVHMLAEIIIQKNSIQDLEKNLLHLLDQLTPFYQAKIETMSREKRRIVDIIALSDGPQSPTEIAKKLNMKPTIVVAQLRKLEKEGIVEVIKFEDRKTTRYEIVERLYRIWRELRTNVGITKINLFVDFLKLWFTRSELYSEYSKTINEFDEYGHSKSEAIDVLKKSCYYLHTLQDFTFIELRKTIEKFMLLGEFDLATNEIAICKEKLKSIDDVLLREFSQLFLDVAIMDMAIANNESESETRKLSMNIDKQIGKLCEKIKSVDIPQTEQFHNFAENLASFLIETDKYELAEKFNTFAIDSLSTSGHCNTVLNQKALIKYHSQDYEESLKINRQILNDLTNPRSLLEARSGVVFNLTRLNKISEAKAESKILRDTNIEYIEESLFPYFREKDYDSVIKIFKESIPKLHTLEKKMQKSIFIGICARLCDSFYHAIADHNNDRKNKLRSCLIIFNETIDVSILNESILKTVMRHKPVIDVLNNFFIELKQMFGAEQLIGVRPISASIDYILTENLEIFEKLHPEERELVLDIIHFISPDLKLPENVLSSVSRK